MTNKTLIELLKSVSFIGFDVRRSPKPIESIVMPPERRLASLLQPNCPTVLSADRSIWPSVFYNQESYQYVENKFTDDIIISETLSDDYFQAFDLWEELSAMLQAYKESSTGDCGVAFGLVKPNYYANELISDDWFDAIYSESGVVPPKTAIDWPLLGFDVVNSGFQSAISGFVLKDKNALEKKWAKNMNDYCLFNSRDQALLFNEHANVDYKADGPFYTLAIFLLWDTNGELKTRANKNILLDSE
ncbi:MAG: hypothetical protein OQK98_15390 [Gammaproteobacteria bacterium]|nr:hypothetical protein [Gammaproteobacteria bacterium]